MRTRTKRALLAAGVRFAEAWLVQELRPELASSQDRQRRHGQPQQRVLSGHLVPDGEQRPVHQPENVPVRELVLEGQDFRRQRVFRVSDQGRQGSKPPGRDGPGMKQGAVIAWAVVLAFAALVMPSMARDWTPLVWVLGPFLFLLAGAWLGSAYEKGRRPVA